MEQSRVDFLLSYSQGLLVSALRNRRESKRLDCNWVRIQVATGSKVTFFITLCGTAIPIRFRFSLRDRFLPRLV
ncbi:MAG: hypothetical protein QOI53_3414 [Verrucomicrobiota bacterium]|nr:hypothetical protein [Verrucomicrobiota bacterium]